MDYTKLFYYFKILRSRLTLSFLVSSFFEKIILFRVHTKLYYLISISNHTIKKVIRNYFIEW